MELSQNHPANLARKKFKAGQRVVIIQGQLFDNPLLKEGLVSIYFTNGNVLVQVFNGVDDYNYMSIPEHELAAVKHK